MEASALRAPAGLAARRPGGVLLRLRSDEQLVALFRQGNEDAFRVIHDRYRQRLSAYARQMLGGSATDADDAMQDVFLRAYSALRADDRPVTLRAWLYRVAHNRCIDHIRRPASQPTVELSESARPLPATTGDPILAAERREDLRRLVLDVRALPEQQRSALLMREMEGLSYQELAGALDVTIPAVKSLLVRARMGLVEFQQARDTPCQAIREDIAGAHDRGVRASGRARRHMRECPGCAGYRTTLKGISGTLGALSPTAGAWSSFAKLIGLGAGGSGAAGGAAAAGAGAGGAAGAGAVGATGTVVAGAAATKLAAVVCCAALVGGGAVEVAREQVVRARPHAPRPAAATAAAGAPAAATLLAVADARHHAGSTAAARRAAARAGTAVKPVVVDEATGLTATAFTAPAPTLTGTPPADSAAGPAHDGGAEAPAEDPAALDPAADPASASAGLDGAGNPLGLLGGDGSTGPPGDAPSTSPAPAAEGGSATGGGPSAPSGSGSTITASGAQATPSPTGGGAGTLPSGSAPTAAPPPR